MLLPCWVRGVPRWSRSTIRSGSKKTWRGWVREEPQGSLSRTPGGNLNLKPETPCPVWETRFTVKTERRETCSPTPWPGIPGETPAGSGSMTETTDLWARSSIKGVRIRTSKTSTRFHLWVRWSLAISPVKLIKHPSGKRAEVTDGSALKVTAGEDDVLVRKPREDDEEMEGDIGMNPWQFT